MKQCKQCEAMKKAMSRLAFYAFRYAIGRNTTAVDYVCYGIKACFPYLQQNDIHIIYTEIEKEKHKGKISIQVYGKGWLELQNWILEEEIKRHMEKKEAEKNGKAMR